MGTDAADVELFPSDEVDNVGNRLDGLKDVVLLRHVHDDFGWTQVDVTPQETIKLVTKH